MLLSLVIPVYNEEEALPSLLESLERVLDAVTCDHEIVFVDDGSRDASRRLLREAATADPRVKVLEFSRNFGHQAAITAGQLIRLVRRQSEVPVIMLRVRHEISMADHHFSSHELGPDELGSEGSLPVLRPSWRSVVRFRKWSR